MKIVRLFTFPVLTALLVACGGGGGGTEITPASPSGLSTIAPAVTSPSVIIGEAPLTPPSLNTVATPVIPPSVNTGATPVTQIAYTDKYIGVWTTACLTNDGVNESGKFVITISKKSDTVLASAISAIRFAGRTCTGAILPNIFPGGVGDITYVDTVNNVDRFSSANNGKSTLKITGSVLNVGNEVNLDTAGYPIINNDPEFAFTKN